MKRLASRLATLSCAAFAAFFGIASAVSADVTEGAAAAEVELELPLASIERLARDKFAGKALTDLDLKALLAPLLSGAGVGSGGGTDGGSPPPSPTPAPPADPSFTCAPEAQRPLAVEADEEGLSLRLHCTSLELRGGESLRNAVVERRIDILREAPGVIVLDFGAPAKVVVAAGESAPTRAALTLIRNAMEGILPGAAVEITAIDIPTPIGKLRVRELGVEGGRILRIRALLNQG